jgi:glyoxylase-like metal-dependent hydrolase (beta-lactamase superfamily II)
MNRWRLICAVLAALLGCNGLRAQEEDLSKVVIGTERVADGVYMLTGQGGNIGVSVGEDGVILIDDQYAPLTEKIRAAIATLSDRPVRFLLNTHWHGDHTGGNENLGRAGVVIVAHENVRQRMGMEQFIEAFNEKVPAAAPRALPVITFTDTVSFHWNGDELRATHVPPAHTDGDTVVYFRKANVVHTGDIFFNGLYPFIDVSSGGSIDGMIDAVDQILAATDPRTRFIPGHGPLGDRQQLEAYRRMLAGVRDRIAPLVGAGKTAREVVEAKPSAAFDESWGKGFLKPEQFVQIVYASLKKKGKL